MPTAPPQVFSSQMNLVKGGPPGDMATLDHFAEIAASVTFDIPAGRVMHVDGDGKYSTGATGWQMPIILRPKSTDSDVRNYGADQWVGVFPDDEDGVLYGYVHSGGFEVETSEYDDAQSYDYNTPIRAQADDTDVDVGGVVTSASIGAVGNPTANVCGIVSMPPADNDGGNYGVSLLRFWTVYCPRQ